EEHELSPAPDPPVAPANPCPERSRHERQRTEDHALVDRDVALEVGARTALPEVAEGLPGAPPEARVRGERDRNVEVEDLLVETVAVDGRVEEDQRDRRGHEAGGETGERDRLVIP